MPDDSVSRPSRLLREARRRARRALGSGVALLRNRYFWAGLLTMVVLGLAIYLLVDRTIMPTFTRYGVATPVPDVMTLPFEEAAGVLDEADLIAEQYILRKPNLPRDVVIDQRPAAGSMVKPGRRIYLTINTGDTSTVSVPRVIGLSLREAQSRIVVLGLTIPEVLPDSIPASHANTVTRQIPGAGERVPHGAEVTLWYSTGLGEAYVAVPQVTGLPLDQARDRLLALRLRSVALGEHEGDDEPVVLTQSPAAGTRVREGYEVRLHIAELAPDGRP